MQKDEFSDNNVESSMSNAARMTDINIVSETSLSINIFVTTSISSF
jgi:hypothetical protein